MPAGELPLFWSVADGWLRTHGNYSHHASALLRGLGLPTSATPVDVAARLRGISFRTASTAITAAGGICTPVRREDPAQDAHLRELPLVQITPLGRASRRPMPAASRAQPLRGVRVLDLTRVIAGPVATRTLAFAGADVLRIDPPGLPEPAWQHLDTGHGKRSALLDVAAEPSLLDSLLARADVIVLGYRPDGIRHLVDRVTIRRSDSRSPPGSSTGSFSGLPACRWHRRRSAPARDRRRLLVRAHIAAPCRRRAARDAETRPPR